MEDVAAVIDAAGGAAFVHGQSSGAVLSLRLAAMHPEKVTRLSVYEPPLTLDYSRPPVPPDATARVSELLAANRRSDAVVYWMTDVVGAPSEAVAEMKSTPMWPALEAVAHTLPYDLAVVGDLMSGKPLPAGAWKEATMPVLVMGGGASPTWIQTSAQTLAATLPRARHETLDGQTHEAAPDLLAAAIEQFLFE
jgi:pimeloyl-ACP methyl ester carboxylesterase